MEPKECVAVAEGKENEDNEEKDDKEEDRKEMVVDLEVLRDGFTPGANGEVPLQAYVNAFTEMSNFFKLLGPLFHFVAFDVNRKLAQLKEKLAGETRQHYVDARTMLDYEVRMGVAGCTSPPSGAVSFLHLHRGFEFASNFMEVLLEEEEEPSLGQVASTLYKATVGRFHPPILSTPFSAVLLLLPSRATVRRRIVKGNTELEGKLKKLMPDIIKAVKETYAASQTLYQERDLLLID
ncbi:ceramide-1-phosphate transfer protein-like isoform X2 [Eriocheir sinensis]|uniref:ceramide-1-phosphate transfer protein-like isoform X2 n=1 Tax=Eriocheir sinensis TaxID=95602 RepID=UPI0021C9906C|nr:ceramide-1-phosphate transfer protein-like isoform X2 [Eriocheir sinensis]